MEEKLIECENKKNFASFCINQLFNSNSSRKLQKSQVFIPSSLIESSLMANLVSPVLHALPSTTFSSSTPALANTLIYSIYILGTRLISRVYIQTPGIGPIPRAYIQFLGMRSSSAVYT